MNYPLSLHKNDTIGLIAPCSPITQERLSQCIHCIEDQGYQVILGNSVTQSLHEYLSGSDEVRANDINQMFCNTNVKAIFCLRGGYGSTRVMELLDYPMIARNPKIFVGYSDVTSFHLAFLRFCDLVTFHGPMVSSNMIDNYDEYTKTSFQKALSMPTIYHFRNPMNHPMQVIVPGQAHGIITGGCLSLVAPCIGTFYQPDFHGKILFLEDIEESLPRCDKLMQQLKNSGILDQVNGILLGNFKDCNNPNDPNYTMYDFFQDFFCGYKKPVLWGIQSGHDKPMGTLPFGTMCYMNTHCDMLHFHYSRHDTSAC